METAPASIVRYASALGRSEMVTRAPDARLQAHVRSYQGYIDSTGSAQRQVPFGQIPMILGFGVPLRVTYPREGTDDARQTFVAGLHDSYVQTSSDGESAGVQVNLTPIGAYRILGVPMHTLTNSAVELGEVWGDAGRTLGERLHDAPDWDARFALIDSLIEERLTRPRRVSRAIVWAWRQLEATHGTASIGTLAGEVGWSRKHLVDQFREYVGLPPKTLARILRFQHALRLINRGEELRWADIAYRCGYYDQAHFNRDFSEFAGTTPREFLTRRLADGGMSGD